MITLRSKDTNTVLGTLTDDDARLLLTHLETTSAFRAGFYVNARTLTLLEKWGASPELQALLKSAIEGHKGTTVTLDGTAKAIARLDPEDGDEEDEQNEEREDGEDEIEEDKEDWEDEDDEDDEDDEEEATAGPRDLRCLLCGHSHFREHRAQLHSGGATLLGLEWLGPTADCYVCSSCGFVHWFLPT